MNNDSTEEYIFYFKSKKTQMFFEFWFLISTFIIGSICLIVISVNTINLPSELLIPAFSALGGFFGGWTFVTKWFYRVTARGKDNQKKWQWEAHKIYWRIFTPIISCIVSIALYAITVSNIIPLITIEKHSFYTAFGFSFLMGYFSDILMTKLFDWTTFMWGGKKDDGDKYGN